MAEVVRNRWTWKAIHDFFHMRFWPEKLCGLFVDSYTTSPFTQAIICKSCFCSISRLAKLSTNSCHENSSMTGTATMTGIRPFQILLGNFLATFRIFSNFFVREQLLATFRKTSTFLVTFWLFWTKITPFFEINKLKFLG